MKFVSDLVQGKEVFQLAHLARAKRLEADLSSLDLVEGSDAAKAHSGLQ